MNLFYLDKNLDRCAEYHVDKHIVKMPLEVAQILCTSIWIDQFLGFVPRALNKEERDLNSSTYLSPIAKKQNPISFKIFNYLVL